MLVVVGHMVAQTMQLLGWLLCPPSSFYVSLLLVIGDMASFFPIVIVRVVVVGASDSWHVIHCR
jgi:hypothetical protein